MISIAITETSQVAEARRCGIDTAKQNGFSDEDSGRVAIVATELATNIIKHGDGGEVLIGTYDANGTTGIEIVALDRGKGTAGIQACFEDGYSTSGTRGAGLGAVRRQSSYLDVVSWPGLGTAVLARLERTGRQQASVRSASSSGAVAVPRLGEAVNGDSWSVEETAGARTLLLADGLGHGPEAADASVEGVRIFNRHKDHKDHEVATLLEYIHGGLWKTRGAAVSIARISPDRGSVKFAGIGNVSAAVVTASGTKRMVSLAGTARHAVRKIQSFDYPLGGGLVILHSDGISNGWSLDRYPGLLAAHPTLIAAVLYRDFARRRDDATVLVVGAGAWSVLRIVLIAIEAETDVVAVRQRARRIAELLGFDRQDQTRIATAVSEIARNAFSYAGGGRAEFLIDADATPPALHVRVSDRGKGIFDLDAVLEGRYKSPSGLGLGLIGARRLMDRFEIESDPATGTKVTLVKNFNDELRARLPAGMKVMSKGTRSKDTVFSLLREATE